VSQGALGSCVKIYIQEGDVAISVTFHGKPYVFVDAVEVQQEVLQFLTSMEPDLKVPST
jgi:hypothetical protein